MQIEAFRLRPIWKHPWICGEKLGGGLHRTNLLSYGERGPMAKSDSVFFSQVRLRTRETNTEVSNAMRLNRAFLLFQSQQESFDIAPVVAEAYVGDDGDGELGYVFHLVLDQLLHRFGLFRDYVEEELVVDLQGHF